MIFVTVGMQLPFDRLIRAMDEWAAETGENVLAQTGAGTYPARTIRTRANLTGDEFETVLDACELMVAHAGMGSILSALVRGKPVIIMPRLAAHGEHRNDHQLATAQKLSSLPGLYVAQDVDGLKLLLGRRGELAAGRAIANSACPRLIHAVREFIAA